MQMDAGLDTGDMLLHEAVDILQDDTTAVLHDRLAHLGGRLIVQALQQAERSSLVPVSQSQDGVTYAHKIEKAESLVDWSRPAEEIARRIRAFDPFPGASTVLGPEVIKLWSCKIDSCKRLMDVPFGHILSVDGSGILVACGEGALRLTVLQRPGGKRLAAADFLRGFDVRPGMVLGGVPMGGAGG
ncbi:MAG: methionyl-tRNA formyltransferase, partial [Giesbergeria sp.]|jgi:methionyl-tRNA formyltransferase|nr:methionyl-tRNA formyltransferase [Giesbergeria sp.]